MIVHEPPYLYETITDGEYVLIYANVFSDPYNPADSIVKVTYTQYDHSNGKNDTTVYRMFTDTSAHVYQCANLTQGDPGTDVTYQIAATDLDGLTRTTPRYTIFHVPGAGVDAASVKSDISIYPNPAQTTLTLLRNSTEPITIEIEDILGRGVSISSISQSSSTIDIQNIPSGVYECVIVNADGSRNRLPFVKE